MTRRLTGGAILVMVLAAGCGHDTHADKPVTPDVPAFSADMQTALVQNVTAAITQSSDGPAASAALKALTWPEQTMLVTIKLPAVASVKPVAVPSNLPSVPKPPTQPRQPGLTVGPQPEDLTHIFTRERWIGCMVQDNGMVLTSTTGTYLATLVSGNATARNGTVVEYQVYVQTGTH